jgi:RNA methyltransferase, TrmH family
VASLDRLAPAGAGHPLVRRYVRLKTDRGHDRGSGLALQGLWMIQAALSTGTRLEAVFVCPELLRGEGSRDVVEALVAARTPTLRVAERLLRRMVDRDGPDGLAAIAEPRVVALGGLQPTDPARVLVLDGPELPGNVGSLVRCADAVGASAVIVTENRVRLSHPVLIKASMGTVLTMSVTVAEPVEALGWLRRHGFRLVAADVGAPSSYREARYGPRVAIVLGSERTGLSGFWREAADQRVAIPMLGRADSLNVGHAGAVLLYEALHAQHSGQAPPPTTTPRSGRHRKEPSG